MSTTPSATTTSTSVTTNAMRAQTNLRKIKKNGWWVVLLPTINFQFVFGIDRRQRGYLGHRDLWWSYGSSHPQVPVRRETIEGEHEPEYREDCCDHSRDIAPYLDV